MNQTLSENDQLHHVFTQKEVKNKLETQGLMTLLNQPPVQSIVPQKSAPLFDSRMI